jgi:U3 small nucleolar RNA-associated protein 13
LKTFEGHTASVLKCSFITRGTQLISAGADGLVKLWTIKTNECVNTFDHHEDKIWALAVNSETEKVATGGGDSVVNMWTDCTIDDEEEAIRQEEEEALKDQDLSNALADTDWVKAVQLAFELRRPFRVLKVFTDLLGSDDANVQIRQIFQSLDKDYWKLLLEYIRDWNAKPKSCHVAQRVLNEFFSVVPASKIVEIPQVRELMEGIAPYTKRHASRIDRLSRSIFLLDYTLARMNVLLPVSEPDAALPHQATSWPSIGTLEGADTDMADAIDRSATDNGGEEIVEAVEPVSPEKVVEEMVDEEPVLPKEGTKKRKKSLGGKKRRKSGLDMRTVSPVR